MAQIRSDKALLSMMYRKVLRSTLTGANQLITSLFKSWSWFIRNEAGDQEYKEQHGRQR